MDEHIDNIIQEYLSMFSDAVRGGVLSEKDRLHLLGRFYELGQWIADKGKGDNG